MAVGCSASISRVILFIINALVWVASIILIAIGGYVLNNSSKYSNLFGEDTNTLTVVCGVIIAVGCFIFLVGFLGCCGAFMQNPCFLKLYFIFLLILVLVEFIGGILAFVYRNDIKAFVQKELYKQVTEYYGASDHKVVTDTIDSLQRDDKCCGVYNYTDYYNSTFSKMPEYAGQAVPKSCCKPDQVNCTAELADGSIEDKSRIYERGCMDQLVAVLEDNFVYIGVAALVLVLVEITAMIMSCCLIVGINKEQKYDAY